MVSVLSCYFPTTIVLVDDNEAFLESVSESLNKSKCIIRTFVNPVEALEFINDVSSTNRLDYSDLMRGGEENMSDWKSVLLNVNCLHREIYSYNRFSIISVVLTDYYMNSMNGVELCAGIEDKNIRKILLTGIAEEKVAIDAFNERYINCFITKGPPNFTSKIKENIYKSIRQYFSYHTENISNHLSIHEKTHLRDPIFANFFLKLCSCKTFVEYYMLDSFGSYLFLNADGEASFLCVLTEHEIDRLCAIGAESGELSPGVLNAIKSKEYMLAYHDRRGALPPISEWEKHLVPARKLSGYQTYYFSVLDGSKLDLDFKNIKSFENYKRSLRF